MSAGFAIVTDDDQFVEGARRSFPELGVSEVRLESYSHEGEFVVLRFSGGVHVALPETRVRRIVTTQLPGEGVS